MEKPCVPFPRFPSGDKTYKALKYVIPTLVTAAIPSFLFYPYFLIFMGSHLCGGGVTHMGCPCNMKDGASLQSLGVVVVVTILSVSRHRYVPCPQIPKCSPSIGLLPPSHVYPRCIRSQPLICSPFPQCHHFKNVT